MDPAGGPVGHELRQAREEGKDVDGVERRWSEAGGKPAPTRGASQEPAEPELRAVALELLDELDALPRPLEASEPEELEAILALADPAPACAPDPERIAGAWVGRAVGLRAREARREHLARGDPRDREGTGNWPVRAGSRLLGLDPAVSERYPWNRASRPTSLAENIDGVPEDDDLNFTMLGLLLLERCGTGFDDPTSRSCGSTICRRDGSSPPSESRCETCSRHYLPPETATRRNPFREWVGARLRVDAYGWAAAGDPVRAARMAWRDARVSHTANGVYAAMFMAAAHAASLGMATRPPSAPTSGYRSSRARAASPRRCAPPASLEGRWEDVVDELYARYGGLHGVHAINNTALVAAALYTFEDFSPAICAVVQGAGTPTRTVPRSGRSSALSARSRSAGPPRSTAASRARCRPSTRSR